jgi:hypothetical protein
MPPRQTTDLDVFVTTRSLRRAERAMDQAGWTREGELRFADGWTGSRWTRKGREVDLIAARSRWAAEAIRAARRNVIGGRRVLTLPYLVLAKLTATRTIDLGDLSRVPGAASEEDLAEVRRVVRRWARPEDIEDLEPLIAAGKLEWVDQPELPPRESNGLACTAAQPPRIVRKQSEQ